MRCRAYGDQAITIINPAMRLTAIAYSSIIASSLLHVCEIVGRLSLVRLVTMVTTGYHDKILTIINPAMRLTAIAYSSIIASSLLLHVCEIVGRLSLVRLVTMVTTGYHDKILTIINPAIRLTAIAYSSIIASSLLLHV